VGDAGIRVDHRHGGGEQILEVKETINTAGKHSELLIRGPRLFAQYTSFDPADRLQQQ